MGFFNAVCHPELAYIEMIWAQLKQLIRPNVDDTDATLVAQMKGALMAIPVSSMQKCARNARDAMRALKCLRANNRLCDPAAVKLLMGAQKRHRMAYASVTAAVWQAAGAALDDAAKKAAATLATRREQAKTGQLLKDRGAERARRAKRKANNSRHHEVLKQRRLAEVDEVEEAAAGGEEAPAEL